MSDTESKPSKRPVPVYCSYCDWTGAAPTIDHVFTGYRQIDPDFRCPKCFSKVILDNSKR